MALFNPTRPDPRIEAEARRRMQIMPSASPRPKAMSIPRPQMAQSPQAPSTMRAPAQARDVTRVDVGMRPVAPPSATAPAPGALPGAPVRPAPPPANPADVITAPGKGMDQSGPVTQEDIDQMIRDRVARDLGGEGIDTAEQEALIRQQMEGAIGAGSVNARARAGRSGMASSGALMAQEGDINRAAREAATSQILGERRDARQEQFDREGQVIDSELAMRRAAADDEINKRLLELLGMDEPGAEGGGVGAPAIPKGVTDALGVETERPSLATSKGAAASIKNGMDAVNAIPVSSPPAGATPVTGAPGIWYDASTRKFYEVQ